MEIKTVGSGFTGEDRTQCKNSHPLERNRRRVARLFFVLDPPIGCAEAAAATRRTPDGVRIHQSHGRPAALRERAGAGRDTGEIVFTKTTAKRSCRFSPRPNHEADDAMVTIDRGLDFENA